MKKSNKTKAPGALPAEARMEHLMDDAGLPEQEVLSLLKAAMGGDDSPPWPANQRWLLWQRDTLIGHVSAQQRWFRVNRQYYQGWHIGGVCVHPDHQGKGIGTFLMGQAHADLSRQALRFAVLNCGTHLIHFYEGVGYSKVSDRGMYIRGGKLAVDEDSAFAVSFQPDFDVSVLNCEAFPFGFDF